MNGGQFNGPIVGSIIGVMSFGAFGNQWKYGSSISGDMIGLLLTGGRTTSTSALIAAILERHLLWLSGYYGPLAGDDSRICSYYTSKAMVVMHGG